MATTLTIPTYDGSGECAHPDVIKVGSTYVMAFTPYKDSDNQYENPSIVTSSDGETWAVPSGLTNPIVASPSGAGYNSDTELVYEDGSYYLFYRENTGSGNVDESIYVRSSTDLVTWGSATELLSGSSLGQFLSPAVLFDGTTWRMWAIDYTTSPNTLRLRTASSPTGPWSSAEACTLETPTGDDPWHFNISSLRSGYLASVTFCDLDQNGSNAYLAFAVSNDGLTFSLLDETIEPTTGIDRVYRGSLLWDGGAWRLWYSHRTTSDDWLILLDEDRTLPAVEPSALAGSASAWPSLKP